MYQRSSNLVFLTFVVTILAFAATNVSAVVCPRCSNVEKVTFATDGESCFVFRNGCMLLTENCGRDINGDILLEEVSKKKCQKLCTNFCTREYAPVCAEYNGQKRTFSNKCMMTNFVCKSGKPWNLFSEAAC